MKLQGLANYKSLKELVIGKIKLFEKNLTEFSALFELMFSEEDNVLAEVMEGYKIKEITYGVAKKNAINSGAVLEELFKNFPKNSIIGLDMANSVKWIETFWAILLAGFKPLLINSRLPKSVLEDVIKTYDVKAVISDSTLFENCETYLISNLQEKGCNREVSSFSFGDEVIFTSSGTQGSVKLCAYTAERFYYQVCDSLKIVTDCPQMIKGCDGKIKQLALLPFYHVFGFTAVYLWFGFFSRTFVFLKDLSPQTILNTVRKHKVTHIFAVPLVWETIYNRAIKAINEKDEKVVKKFNKGLKLAKKNSFFKRLTKKGFFKVREQIFGESISFLISGGAGVGKNAIEFFNAIGYHIANGYGMTELGITSVELSPLDSVRNSLSIGKPLNHAEYKIEKGNLWVKSSTRATRILFEGKETVTDFDKWFNTEDLAKECGERFFIEGRADDLLIGETGENLNPNVIEKLLTIEGVSEICLFLAKDGVPTLIAYCPKIYSKESVINIKDKLNAKILENNLGNEIRRVVLTLSPLLDDNDFKISRKSIAKKFDESRFEPLTVESFDNLEISALQDRLQGLFAKILQKEKAEVGVDENFFSSLGGTSLDYFALIELIKDEMGVTLPIEETQKLSTIRSVEAYVKGDNYDS